MTENTLIFIIVTGVGIMITFALAVILFFNISQKKIQSEKLKTQQLKLDFQRNLLEKTIQTQEEERNRIARELHDDIGSKLNIIHLNLHLLKTNLQKDKDVGELLEDIQIALQNSIESSRHLSHELIPPTLQKFGIQSAIDDLQHSVNRNDQLELNIQNDQNWKIEAGIQQLHLFRIIQELIQNALKHAFAKQLNLSFVTNKQQLKITYQDDGVGFSKENTGMGLGLENLHTRVQLLGGSWYINHDTPKGAEIKISIPL